MPSLLSLALTSATVFLMFCEGIANTLTDTEAASELKDKRVKEANAADFSVFKKAFQKK